jgi:hypothetical protein
VEITANDSEAAAHSGASKCKVYYFIND